MNEQEECERKNESKELKGNERIKETRNGRKE